MIEAAASDELRRQIRLAGTPADQQERGGPNGSASFVQRVRTVDSEPLDDSLQVPYGIRSVVALEAADPFEHGPAAFAIIAGE